MKAETSVVAAGRRSMPPLPQCIPTKRAFSPHPSMARKLIQDTEASAPAATEEENTSRTVASQERNRNVTLALCFILFPLSKPHASTSN